MSTPAHSVPPTSLEGWSIACRTLEALGVTHVFGLPGTQTVPLYEAIRRSGLTTVVPTSELAAAFMAGAFYRASGRPAVLATIPGPGFAFALAGLAEARLDSAALIHLTIAAPDGPHARFALQAIPQDALGTAIAKGTFRIETMAEIVPVMRAAHALATEGEPGPVIVSFVERADAAPMTRAMLGAATPRTRLSIADGWSRVATARYPLLLAGQGAAGAATEVVALAETLGAPVLTTPGGRGIIREDHPLSMPFDPYRGALPTAQALVAAADLVLVLGAKLGHNGTAGHALPFDPARMVQIDTDETNGGGRYGNAGVVATVKAFLADCPASTLHRSRWTEAELAALRKALRHPPRTAEPHVDGHEPARFFGALREALPPNTVIVTDTGSHQMLTRRHLDILAPRGLLVPSDFQSMGFGLPAAIAACLADPTRPTIAVIGDGGLAMSGLEIATAAAHGLPLPILVFVDGFLNQIRLHQAAEYGHDSGVALPPIDLEAFADAVGAAFAVGDDMAALVRAALARRGPTVIAVPVGDSPALRRIRRIRRAKESVRRVLGGRLLRMLHR